jgi:hypothetical protein
MQYKMILLPFDGRFDIAKRCERSKTKLSIPIPHYRILKKVIFVSVMLGSSFFIDCAYVII